MNPDQKVFISGSYTFEEDNPLDTKIMILHTFLWIIAAISLFFFTYGLIFSIDNILLYINPVIFTMIALSLYLLKKRGNYKAASYIGTLVLFLALTTIAINLQNQNFTIVWTYFFAPFSMIVLGVKRGVLITFIYLAVLITASCYGIGVWQDGTWNGASCIRFAMAHLVMVYAIYAIVSSYEKAYKRIEMLREREMIQLKLFEKLSITDPLTGLYNRRSLKKIFPKAFNEAKHNNRYFAYFLMDIDHFKHYNDTYGHQEGDKVLIEIAKLLHKRFNFSFRIGGDEFSGIIICNDENTIKQMINDLHRSIASLHIENKKSPISKYLTCSIGVHIIPKFEYNYEEIYHLTDKALYRAKALGRNRVIYL